MKRKTKEDPNEKLGTLSESNFREWAKAAVETYNRKGMIADAMVWSRIIAYYESALESGTLPVAK